MKTHRIHRLVIILVFCSYHAGAQDRAFGKKVVDTLTSPYFWGRGYTKNGMQKAAIYIADRFKEFGLVPMAGQDFFQPFTYNVNTFPGKMEVSINKQKLVPGKDFIMSPGSRGARAHGELVKADSLSFMNPKATVLVELKEKLTWSVDDDAADVTRIEIAKKISKNAPS